MSESNSYRQTLMQELEVRRNKNPSYSMRAFSSFLGTSPATLSQILSGKRKMTLKTAKTMADRLSLSPVEVQSFLYSILGEEFSSKDMTRKNLDIEEFKVISSWYHYAILSLGDIPNNKADPEWISKRLGITNSQSKSAFERLLQLGFIEREGSGYRQKTVPLSIDSKTAAPAIRSYHRQNLYKAIDSLEGNETSERNISSITFAGDANQLAKASKLIIEFRRKIAEFMGTTSKEKVYTCAIQLFPVSKD